MYDQLPSVALLFGRILLGLIFLLSGVMKMFNWPTTANSMAEHGMPAVPFFLAGAIFCEVVGGLSVILGFKARYGALLLALFLIPTTLVFHHFWTFSGGEMQNQMQHFLKNLSILGGLLTLSAAGAGRYALDAVGPWVGHAERDVSRPMAYTR